MKKQYFIYSVITCMLVIFNVKAQNTPIDDFLKKYPTMEGVTSVSMSQQMLQAIFDPKKRINSELQSTAPAKANSSVTYYRPEFNVPEAYNSVSVSRTDIPANLYADLKKTLMSSKYEQYMEMNKENSIIVGYYLKKVNDKCNEIVVLRQQKDQFSAIYIRGDIEINKVDSYLSRIRTALNNQMNAAGIGIYQPNNQIAFTMPSFNNYKSPNLQGFAFKFDSDSITFKWNNKTKEQDERNNRK